MPYRHEVSFRVLGPADQVRARLPAGIATVEEIPADGPAPVAAADRPGPSLPGAASGARESGHWVRVRLRAERLEWIPSLLAWLDLPFVIEYPDALRGHVHALAGLAATSAGDVPGTAGQPRPED